MTEHLPTAIAVLALISTAVTTLISWRKDRREDRAEPITHDTAVIAQQKTVVDAALQLVESLSEQMGKVRAEQAAQGVEIADLRSQQVRDKAMIRRLMDRIARLMEHIAHTGTWIAARLPGETYPALAEDLRGDLTEQP